MEDKKQCETCETCPEKVNPVAVAKDSSSSATSQIEYLSKSIMLTALIITNYIIWWWIKSILKVFFYFSSVCFEIRAKSVQIQSCQNKSEALLFSNNQCIFNWWLFLSTIWTLFKTERKMKKYQKDLYSIVHQSDDT